MKIFLRLFLGLLFVSITLLAFAFFFWYRPKFKPPFHYTYPAGIGRSSGELSRLHTKATLLKQYAVTHRFNGSRCFLVDMKVASGKNRFFVYDLEKDSVILAGLVAHGNIVGAGSVNAHPWITIWYSE